LAEIFLDSKRWIKISNADFKVFDLGKMK
jgi:hypothetical protein